MEECTSRVLSLQEYRFSVVAQTPADDDTPSPVIGWAHVADRGRGLIAYADFEPAMIIDVAPAIAVTDEECAAKVRQYVFQCRRDDCPHGYAGPTEQALVFGPMALCNHSDTPNAAVRFVQHPENGLEARLITLCRIDKGEEITIRYTDSNWYKDSGRF